MSNEAIKISELPEIQSSANAYVIVTVGGTSYKLNISALSTAYQKPQTGIPKTDLADGVQTSLGKADNAAPQATTYTKTEVDTALGGKTDKVTGATDGEVAAFDASGNLKKTDIPSDNVAQKDGYYEGLTAGLAENLVDTKGEGSEQEFLDRTACGDVSIADDGSGVLKSIKGRTRAWNQLRENGNFATSAGWSARQATVSISNNIATVTPATDGEQRGLTSTTMPFIGGHKYYLKVDILSPVSSSVNLSLYGTISPAVSPSVVANVWTRASSIVVPSTNVNYSLYALVNERLTTNQNIQYKNFIVVDLTLLYGSEIDGMTDAEILAKFEKDYPLSYYPYNAGKLINNAAKVLETVGFNQWDEEWETGKINSTDGTNSTDATRIRSKNYIPVFGGQKYYLKNGGSGVVWVFTYDANKNYLTYYSVNNAEFIPSAETAYIRICPDATYGTTYGNDICINLSWSGYRNGEYEPYWKRETALNLDSFDVKDAQGNVTTIHGLKQAGSVCDEIKDGKFIKRVGSVDLGDLTWNAISGSITHYTTSLTDHEFTPYGRGQKSNITCEKYAPAAPETSPTPDKTVCFTNDSVNLYVRDSAYQSYTGPQFKAAMSGVMMNYALATPIEYDLVNPINGTYKVADFGTERIVPVVDELGNPCTAPFAATIKYNDDFTREIVNLPQNYVRRDALKQGLGDDATLPMSQKAATENLAVKAGTEDALTAGLAKNLIDTKGAGSEQVFTRRTSCGSESIADDGSALFKKYLGKSIVWNQLLDKNDLYTTQTYKDVTATGDRSTGTITFSGTANGNEQFALSVSSALKMVRGHKYLLKGATSTTPKLRMSDQTYLFDSGDGCIWTCAADNVSVQLACQIVSGVTYSGTIKVKIVDLTLMFGAGNEPSTVAEFEALFSKPYYAYNAGQIIDNKVEEYQTVGFNQWDEEWEYGTLNYNTGEKSTSPTPVGGIVSKNFIPIFPNTTYNVKNSVDSTLFNRLAFYDKNKVYLGGTNGGWTDFSNGHQYTTPANAYYCRFCVETSTYNGDICFNLSWSGYRNGEYEPYWKKVLPTKLNSFKVTDGENEITIEGLKSAGSVYDEIDLVRKKYIKRVGSVDLGTLTWYTYTNSGGKMSFWANLADAKINAVTNIFSERHIGASEGYVYGSNQLDKTICIHSELARIYVADLTYSTAGAFKTAMNGVIAYYELATPVEYDLVDDILDTLTVADFGTEYASPTEEVDAAGVPKSAPFRAVIKYSDDMTRTIVNLPKNFQSQESMDAMLTALGTALGFTWSKAWDASNHKYNYTITPTSNGE